MVKERISVSMDKELNKWLQDKVREGKFKSISQGIRECVKAVRQAEGEWEK